MSTSVAENVKHYYGQVLESKNDLKTGACCPMEAMPANIRPLLQNIHAEVQERFYGCGSPIPPLLEGKTVLDLGCGTGRDVYLLSQLVGESGHVIGVDMTEEQLAVAKEHLDWHMKEFGYKKSNVTFHQGMIEELDAIGIADDSIDVVTSNCVLNLSGNKERLFSEIERVLKPGGELYFSDIFADRRIPEALQQDEVLHGECLAGALYVEDFRRVLQKAGFQDFRVMATAPVPIHDKEVEQRIGMVRFVSQTIRTFKCDFEDRCENYGQVVFYKGTIPEHPHRFALDDHHLFEAGLPMNVCSNTAMMLAETRFRPHFKIIGNTETHYGLFDCGPTSASVEGDVSAACC